MLFEGTTAETDAVLRAMKHVATAGGTDRNFWTHVDEPLEAVRHAMGVPRLGPADAADGAYPDWYEPTA
jgi:hypothetical protein